MAVKRICKYDEKILYKKTSKVNFNEMKDKLPEILKDMEDTLQAVKGIGLAANQIGLDLQISIIDLITENRKHLKFVMINPTLVEKSGVLYEDEGCLSFPGLFARVKRYAKVKVKALNEKGLPIEIDGYGLLARALQHELDHLNGITFIERLPLLTRLKLKPVLLKLKRQWKKIDESKIYPKIM